MLTCADGKATKLAGPPSLQKPWTCRLSGTESTSGAGDKEDGPKLVTFDPGWRNHWAALGPLTSMSTLASYPQELKSPVSVPDNAWTVEPASNSVCDRTIGLTALPLPSVKVQVTSSTGLEP